MSQDERDRQALARAARGSTSDLERVYDDYVDGLYAYVYFQNGCDPRRAEEVVEETFARALDGAGGARPQGETMVVTLRRLARDLTRERRAREGAETSERWERLERDLADRLSSLEAEPVSRDVCARPETRDLVEMTLANLPERYRLALVGRYIEGEGLGGLGLRFDLGRDATEALLVRARAAFADTLAEIASELAEDPA